MNNEEQMNKKKSKQEHKNKDDHKEVFTKKGFLQREQLHKARHKALLGFDPNSILHTITKMEIPPFQGYILIYVRYDPKH